MIKIHKIHNILLTIVTSSLLTIFTVISTQSGSKSLNQMIYVANSILEIVNNLNDKDLKKFDVVVFGYDEQLHFLAEEIIRKLADRTNSVNFEQKSHDEKISSKCSQAPKIILASQDFEFDISEPTEVEMRNFYAYHNAVIIFYYLNESNMTIYTNTFYKLIIEMKPSALFIGHATDRNSNNLNLYGYVKYSTCNETFFLNLSLRNSFNASTMKWTNQTFQDEYKNFNGCPLIVFVPAIIECSLIFKVNEGQIIGLDYPYGRLIHLYAKKHNATIQVESKMSLALTFQIDIMLAHTTQFGIMPKWMFTPTVAIDEHKLAILVTLGGEFTPFEKLILPFDSATWYLNIFTVLAGFLVILILYHMPTYMQKFVFGTYNRNPSMGLSQIFFGIGLIQTPGRNFARFMFMMFTIFCLIMRTTYQSKMYDFLQYDVRQPTMKTIDEVRQRNISLTPYMVFPSDEIEKELGINSRNVSAEDIERLFVDEEGEYAYIVNRDLIKCLEMTKPVEYRKIDKRMRMTDDDLVSGLNSWYIFRFSVVHDSLNKFLLECHQHGFISHLKKSLSVKIHNLDLSEKETTKVLSMYMLSAGFYVWLASIGIACVVFVFEHILKHLTRQ